MRKAYKFLVLLAGFMLLQQQACPQTTNYKFHTVFIYNFTKYIKWPEGSNKGNFVIGVLGKCDITASLKEMAASKTVNGRAIEIKNFNRLDELKACHMVFLPHDQSAEIGAIRAKLNNQPTLIISEKEGLAEQGSDINFIMSEGRWKFEINQATTEMRNLKISHELIKFALKVHTEVLPFR